MILAELAHGHIAARCLHVIADFGVADALGQECASAAALAERTGLDADALNRMLRLLAAHGVLVKSRRRFTVAPTDVEFKGFFRQLHSDVPVSE